MIKYLYKKCKILKCAYHNRPMYKVIAVISTGYGGL